MRASRTILILVVGFLGLISQHAFGQVADEFGLVDGSIIFVDAESDSRCGAVNTINADFFIRSCDRRLILLSGEDRETPFTVDENYAVFRDDGVEAGRIRFATDNDGKRQVFWLSDENFPEGENLVLRYVATTDQLAVATISGQDDQSVPVEPINVTLTECDPFASYDGGDEILCPRTLPSALCGSASVGLTLALGAMLGFMKYSVRRKRS